MTNYAAWTGAYQGLLRSARFDTDFETFMRDELFRQRAVGFDAPDFDAVRRQWREYKRDGDEA